MMEGATSGPWQQQNNSQQATQQNVQTQDTWNCPNCKIYVSGKFCPECGHQC